MAKDWFPNTNAGRKTVGADQTKVQFSGYWFRWLPVLLMVLLLLTTLGGIGTGIMETVGLLYWVSEWIGRGIYGVALALAWWWAHQYGPWKITARPGSLLLERGQRRWVIPWTEIEKVSATDDGVVLHQSRAPDLTLLAHQGKGTCRNVATDLNHLVDDFGGTQRASWCPRHGGLRWSLNAALRSLACRCCCWRGAWRC